MMTHQYELIDLIGFCNSCMREINPYHEDNNAYKSMIGAMKDLAVAAKQTIESRDIENEQLWSIFKTCFNCKRCVPGVIFGCEIQRHIDLSGTCNQRELRDDATTMG